jgi:hypothetical protein
MPQKKFSKILSILMGLLMGLVTLFFIVAFLFPDQNLPTLKDLLKTEGGDQFSSEENGDIVEFNLENSKELNEELKQLSLTAFEDKTNAWDLLIASHEVGYQEHDFGIFIEEINGLKGNEDSFWAIYVNDESALLGIRDIVLNEGDTIEFRYEAIKE